MKIEMNVNDVLTPITHAASVLASKNAIDILSCLHFCKDASQSGMVITGSNGEVWLMMMSDIISCDVESFSFCVEAKEFLPILRTLKGQTVTLVFNEGTHIVECQYKKGHSAIPYKDGDDYPKPKQMEGEAVSIVVKSRDITKALELTRAMMSNDALRPILNGVHIDVTSDTMVAVSTDAHRLVKTTHPIVKGVEEKQGFTIPSNAVNVLLPLLMRKDTNDDDVTLLFTSTSLCVTCGDDSMVCRLPEGRFPNYDAVIPHEGYDNVLVIDKNAMMDALGRMLLVCNEKSQLVKVSLSALTGVTLRTEDMDFSTSGMEQVDATYEGEDLEIGFKGDFLMQGLDNVPCDKVKVKVKDIARAALLLPNDDEQTVNYVSILMPMRVN